jgi:hypothetical protein
MRPFSECLHAVLSCKLEALVLPEPFGPPFTRLVQ